MFLNYYPDVNNFPDTWEAPCFQKYAKFNNPNLTKWVLDLAKARIEKYKNQPPDTSPGSYKTNTIIKLIETLLLIEGDYHQMLVELWNALPQEEKRQYFKLYEKFTDSAVINPGLRLIIVWHSDNWLEISSFKDEELARLLYSDTNSDDSIEILFVVSISLMIKQRETWSVIGIENFKTFLNKETPSHKLFFLPDQTFDKKIQLQLV